MSELFHNYVRFRVIVFVCLTIRVGETFNVCILCHNLVSKLSQSVRELLAILIGNLLHVTTCNHGHICHFLQVDSHNIIPCWQASPKLEYGARTIRPKIHNQMREFLTEFPPVIKHPHAGKASIKVTSYF